MAMRKGISPDQLKQASASLGLTVAAIAEGSGLTKAYISEFRSNTRNLTGPQQVKLRTFLEEQCAKQGVDFPEGDEATDPAGERLMQGLGGLVQRITRPAILLSDDIPKAQADKLLNLIDANRLKVSDLLAGDFEADGGLLLGGDGFAPATEEAIRQIFALLALNYLAILMLQGRSIVRRTPADAPTPKTIGDWLSGYLADSPLADLLPPEDKPAAPPVVAAPVPVPVFSNLLDAAATDGGAA